MLVISIYFLSGLNKTSVIVLYGLLFVNPKRLKKQYLHEKVVSLLFCLVSLFYRRLAFTYNERKKGPAGKKSPVFSPGNS